MRDQGDPAPEVDHRYKENAEDQHEKTEEYISG